MPPLWRYVRYTDDGCALYQCLQCKGQWDGRSEPGWYQWFEEVDGPGEGVRTYTKTVDGKKVPYYMKDRETPIYHPHFNFCPICGIRLEGAVVVQEHNERMLGPRRWTIQQAIQEREDYHARNDPDWWWVIQERTVWSDRDEPDPWQDKLRADPRKIGAVRMWKELQNVRKQLAEDHANPMFDLSYEARVTRKNNDEFAPYCSVHQLYR